jgi:hypothetical protein
MSVREVDVLSLAFTRLNETGLRAKGWSFKLNTNKTRNGVCKFGPRRIEISRHALNEGMERVQNTLAHEIAHALVGPHHGHNDVWRSKAIELGCNGERCSGNFTNVREQAIWVGVCPNGHKFFRHRLRQSMRGRTSCPNCSGGVFNKNFLLDWQHNG